MFRILVLGGGAAGFFAALRCKELAPQASVVILEGSGHVLSKVRISGGGRCNVTHACPDIPSLLQGYPRGQKELRGAFHRFSSKDTVSWFTQRGVPLKTEDDGRMFPISDSSQTILDCLKAEAERLAVSILLHARVERILATELSAAPPPPLQEDSPPLCPPQGGLPPQTRSPSSPTRSRFLVFLENDRHLEADAILLATGGHPSGAKFARSLGHRCESPVPSLFTFAVKDARLTDLAGLSFEQARLKLSFGNDQRPLEDEGPLLITHWGLSGPAVLKLSAWGARLLHACGYNADLHINLLPGLSRPQIEAHLHDLRLSAPRRQISSHPPFPFPKRFWQRLCSVLGIPDVQPWAEMSAKLKETLVSELSAGRYRIQGKGIFKDEFVTCGGVLRSEVDFKTMQSRLCPGLFFAGEILDIDGITGGYNFQNAWTTGFLAGSHLAALATSGRFGDPAEAKV